MFSRKTVCFGLYINKTCVPDIFSESPLNTDTRITRTLWPVPLVSVLTGFHCTCKQFQKIIIADKKVSENKPVRSIYSTASKFYIAPKLLYRAKSPRDTHMT